MSRPMSSFMLSISESSSFSRHDVSRSAPISSSSSRFKSLAKSASAPPCDGARVFIVMNPFASSFECFALGPNRRAPP